MYERHSQPLAPRKKFIQRLARNVGCGLVLICCSLFVGIMGYHFVGELSWIDAFHNAAMILSGMGPVDTLHSDAAKLFAGCYAIYSGLALVSTAAITFAPIVHRVLHKFHLAESQD